MESKWRAGFAFSLVLIIAVFSSIPAIRVLTGAGGPFGFSLTGMEFFHEVRFSVDALSAWFILIINFTMVTAGFYSIGYMDHYKERVSSLVFHWVAFVIFHLSMLAVCTVQNGMAFLVAWEIMSLSSFFLVIFEHDKPETIKAGLNYLVQMHISMVLLTVGVIWMYLQTGSLEFSSLSGLNPSSVLPLFIVFFFGFAFKAGFNLGFIPLHTWLPKAHPAAPSHISAIMSGVMIKIGIFGILKMIQLFPFSGSKDYLILGWAIMTVSVLSGLYGVMLAIIQHNLKKLLAYHSIENIGIIGMGIGLGCLGLGYGNQYLAIAGFAGALLHSLNHSLFKSLLFLAAGNVYHAVHTMNLESLGGLIRRMPHTSLLFLLAALAICGLPPFNGFISEFIIYSGLYQGTIQLGPVASVMMILSIIGLALIGGLAMLCFTKAFGIVFLGESRTGYPAPPVEASAFQLVPMYLTGLAILAIGLFPAVFFRLMTAPLGMFVDDASLAAYLEGPTMELLGKVGSAAMIFIAISALILGLRYFVQRKRVKALSVTWGCGYVSPSPQMQYTANSFVRKYRKLAAPALSVKQEATELHDVFPQKKEAFKTHPGDKLEKYVIEAPVTLLTRFLGLFRFIQNGQIQYYLLYGLVLLVIVMVLSLIPTLF